MPKKKGGGFDVVPAEDPEVIGCLAMDEGAAERSGRGLHEEAEAEASRWSGGLTVHPMHLMLTLAFCALTYLLLQQSQQLGTLDRRLQASEKQLRTFTSFASTFTSFASKFSASPAMEGRPVAEEDPERAPASGERPAADAALVSEMLAVAKRVQKLEAQLSALADLDPQFGALALGADTPGEAAPGAAANSGPEESPLAQESEMLDAFEAKLSGEREALDTRLTTVHHKLSELESTLASASDSKTQLARMSALEHRMKAEEELLLMHRLAGAEPSPPGRAYLELSKDCMKDENAERLKKVTGVNLQACRKNCDDDITCKGFSFLFKSNVATCVTRKKGCADIAPGPCDYSKGWCSFKLVEGYRPKSCPQDMPPSDPWWGQYAKLSKQHSVCGKMSAASGDNNALSKCPEMSITNRKRVDTLRQVLSATHKILTHLDVKYVVNAGTSIGHERCKDVIPWDADNDIVVESDDTQKMAGIFKEPNPKLARRFVSMDSFGFPEMMFTEVRGCIGWRVVHMPTGIYTDMFPLKTASSGGKPVVKYLYHLGNAVCSPSEFRSGGNKGLFDKDESCSWKKCVQTPADWFWPAMPCKIAGIDTYCPKNAPKYLTQLYSNYVQGSHPVRDLV